MVHLCFSPQYVQSVPLKQGDWVRYIGLDPRIQQDYGNQDLRILAVDAVCGIAVCDNTFGQRLVGVAIAELQLSNLAE